MDQLASRQARFVTELNKSAQATDRSEKNVKELRSAISALNAEQKESRGTTSALSTEQAKLAAAHRAAATANSGQIGVLRRFFGEGRRALSITQRPVSYTHLTLPTIHPV